MNYTWFIVVFIGAWFGLVFFEKQAMLPDLLLGLKDYVALLTSLGIGVAVKNVGKRVRSKSISDESTGFFRF